MRISTIDGVIPSLGQEKAVDSIASGPTKDTGCLERAQSPCERAAILGEHALSELCAAAGLEIEDGCRRKRRSLVMA